MMNLQRSYNEQIRELDDNKTEDLKTFLFFKVKNKQTNKQKRCLLGQNITWEFLG